MLSKVNGLTLAVIGAAIVASMMLVVSSTYTKPASETVTPATTQATEATTAPAAAAAPAAPAAR